MVGLATLINIIVAMGPFTYVYIYVYRIVYIYYKYLSLPFAFYEAGYVLGVIICILALIVSYISAEFIVETIGISNAIM